MPSLPATAHMLEDSQDARCASENKHRLPVPARRHPPTPQPSAQRAHTRTITFRPMVQLTSRLRRWEWIPTRGSVKRMLTSLPPPSEMALARQPGPRPQRTHEKLTNRGTPRPHHRTPCDARQHGNRQKHSVYRFATARRALTRALQMASSNGSPASIASLPTVSGAFDSLLRHVL
jgi:hypothetical protein